MAKKYFLLIFIFVLPLLVFSQTLENIKAKGEINIAFTKSNKNTVNYTIAKEFAKFLNVKFNEVPIEWGDVFAKDGEIPTDYSTNPQISYVPDALKKADIICGTIYLLDWRKKFFDYSGIVQVSDLLIVRKNLNKSVKSFEDLKNLNIAFLANSSYETSLKKISDDIGGGIKFTKTKSEEEALEMLSSGEVDGLITVSYLALSYLRNSPMKFKLAFPLNKPKDVGWAVRTDNIELKNEIKNFFETIKGNGRLDELFRTKYKIDYSTYVEIINSYAQSQKGVETRDFDAILESGTIKIALRDREMVYHPSGKKQFNTYLAEKFANYLGLQAEFVYTEKFSNYFENSKGEIDKDSSYIPDWFNDFDVACDLIAPLDWRLKKVDVLPFMPNAMVVIGRKDTRINSINDLTNLKGVTSKGSSYETALTDNEINNFYYSSGNYFFSDLLSKKADYTISNIKVFDLADYPELEAKFILGEISKMGWAIKKNQPQLRQKILEFFEYAKDKGIFDEYFKIQTGMTLQSADNYLTVLHESYKEGYFPFVFYGTDKGLPQEDVLSTFQDTQGYLWFGTYSGVVKYNGRRMKLYDISKGLINNVVNDIAEDKNGKIYFATLGGLSVFDKTSGEITNYFKGISIDGIYIYKNLIYFFNENGIYQLKNGKQEIYLNETIKNLPKNINSLSLNPRTNHLIIASNSGVYVLNETLDVKQINSDYCHYAFYDIDGGLWTSTHSGLFYATKIQARKGQVGKNVSKLINIENTVIRKISQTKDGSLWLVSDFKVYQLLTLKQKPIIYDEKIGLKNYRILSFLIDNEGNQWFGFSGGMQKLTNKSLRTLFPENLDSYINSVFEDKLGRVWFGMSNKVSYFKEELVNFSEKIKTNDKSFVITETPENNILIANSEGIYVYDLNTLKLLNSKMFDSKLFYLKDIFISSKGEVFLLTGSSGIVYYMKSFDSQVVTIENNYTSLISQIIEFDGKIIGTNNSGLVVFEDTKFTKLINTKMQTWSVATDVLINPETKEETEVLWLGTQKGLYRFYQGKLEPFGDEFLSNIVINAIKPAEDKNKLWLGTNQGVFYYNKVLNRIEFSVNSKDGLLGNEITIDGLLIDGRGLLWVGTYHGMSTFDIKKKKLGKSSPICRIESYTINGETFSVLPKVLPYSNNNIDFEISGLSFKDEFSVYYEFYLQGLDENYSKIGKENIASYSNLPPGHYSFKYRTKGKDGIWSYYQKVDFVIQKPIYLEWWFIISVIATFLFLVWIIFKWRIQILKKRNELLEQTVIERTAEISEKNIELETQKEEIEAQKDFVTSQRDEIAQRKKEVDDSILYAKRIQNAIMPPQSFISKLLPQNFILFKPRDIVSGDYYWVAEKDDKTYYAAADCTGHGVPGAFMSMLGVSFLNDIISASEGELKASEVLDQLRLKVIKALHQTGEVHEAKDGMDIALCVVDYKTNTVQFAGAFNPLFIIRGEELIVVPSDRMPIGIYEYEGDRKPFTNNIFQAEKGDLMYVFSDGYADQFGGPRGKKFMLGRFKKVLLKIKDMPMDEQRQYLDDTIEKWRKGVSSQIDDIIVIGVKI